MQTKSGLDSPCDDFLIDSSDVSQDIQDLHFTKLHTLALESVGQFDASNLSHFPNVQNLTLYSLEAVDIDAVARALPNLTSLVAEFEPVFTTSAQSCLFVNLTSLSCMLGVLNNFYALRMLKCVPTTLQKFAALAPICHSTVMLLSTKFQSLKTLDVLCLDDEVLYMTLYNRSRFV